MGLGAEALAGLLLPGVGGLLLFWFLFPIFGRIGAEGLLACLGVGANGLLGGDGRFVGALGGFLDVSGDLFFVGVLVWEVVGRAGEVGLVEVFVTA